MVQDTRYVTITEVAHEFATGRRSLPKSVTLNDLEKWPLFCVILLNSV